MQEMKQYVCDLYLHDKPDGPSIGMGKEVAVVLYADAVKMQREAYWKGARTCGLFTGIYDSERWCKEVDAAALREYPDG